MSHYALGGGQAGDLIRLARCALQGVRPPLQMRPLVGRIPLTIRCNGMHLKAALGLPYRGLVPVVVSRSEARSLGPVYDTRQIDPPVSSAISSDPSFITARAAGRPHTSARCSPEVQKPVRKFS